MIDTLLFLLVGVLLLLLVGLLLLVLLVCGGLLVLVLALVPLVPLAMAFGTPRGLCSSSPGDKFKLVVSPTKVADQGDPVSVLLSTLWAGKRNASWDVGGESVVVVRQNMAPQVRFVLAFHSTLDTVEPVFCSCVPIKVVFRIAFLVTLWTSKTALVCIKFLCFFSTGLYGQK